MFSKTLVDLILRSVLLFKIKPTMKNTENKDASLKVKIKVEKHTNETIC